MKGLIYRELITMKKSLIICAVIYIVALIGAAVLFPAFEYGNLADMAKEDKESTFEMVRMYASIILFTVAACGPPIGHNEQIPADIKTGWMKFSYTMPVSLENIAKAKLITRMGLVYIGSALGFLGEVFIGAISGTGVRQSMLVLLLSLMLIEHFTALEIPAMIRFKDQKKIAAGGMIVGLVIVSPAFIVMRDIVDKVGTGLKEILETAQKTDPDATLESLGIDTMKYTFEVARPYLDVFGKCLVIAFVPLAVILIVCGYKWTVKELKRRSL